MDRNLRRTIIAGAVAALIGMPAWAAKGSSDAMEGVDGAETSHQEAQTGLDGAAGRSSAAGDKSLHSLTPGELRGKKVVDASGDDVGTIDGVVFDAASEALFAVISASGLAQGGTDRIVVPLDELRMAEDDELSISSTREQIEGRDDTDYGEARYRELDSDAPISEFSALELDESDPASRSDRTTSDATAPR